MITKYEDLKWNGIPVFGKRFGRYNLLFVYIMICIGLLGFFAIGNRLIAILFAVLY